MLKNLSVEGLTRCTMLFLPHVAVMRTAALQPIDFQPSPTVSVTLNPNAFQV